LQKTLTGQEDIMNTLYRYHVAVSGLGPEKAVMKKVKIAPMWTC